MDYAALIPQTEDQLKALEARQRIACFRDRLRFIRLLKTQHAKTQQQAGQAVGLAIRQSQRLWKIYRTNGLEALLEEPKKPGFGKLSAHQISQLQGWLRTDQAQTLIHIQTYIRQRWTIDYTLAGISALCNRLKIKPKAGRPVNRRQDPAAREAFKKTLLN